MIKHFDITNKLFIPKISNNRSVKSEVKSEVSNNSSNTSEAQPKITSFLRKPSTEPSTENTEEITEACKPSCSKIVPPNLICEAPCNQRNPNVKILDCVIIPPTKRASDLPLSVATLAIPSTSNNNYLPDVTPLLPLSAAASALPSTSNNSIWKSTKYSRSQRNKRKIEKFQYNQPLITNFISILEKINSTLKENGEISKALKETMMVCLNEPENEPDENKPESRPESMPANKFLNMLLKTDFGTNLVFFWK